MDWPRIIYHLTDGNKKAEKGTGNYTYQPCENEMEFKKLEKDEWRLTIDELYETSPVPTLEPTKIENNEPKRGRPKKEK